MNEQIHLLWQQLEAARARFETELSHWTPEDLRKKPEGGWCALQVMDHLIYSERGTFAYLQKKTSSGWESLPLAGDEHAQAARTLNERLISSDRWAMPPILSEPSGDRSFEEQVAEWQRLRDEMGSFIAELDHEFYPRLVFRQPIAGPLDLYQTLSFLANHIDHHMHQLGRIKAAVHPA